MPKIQLRARFFVGSDGVVFPKARHLSKKQRGEIFRRDDYRCQYCGIPVVERSIGFSEEMIVDRAQIDHILPISRGGRSDPDNLRTACRRCNSSKGPLRNEPRRTDWATAGRWPERQLRRQIRSAKKGKAKR